MPEHIDNSVRSRAVLTFVPFGYKRQVRKGDDRAAIGAQIVLAAIQGEGEEELQRPLSGLAFSG